MALFCDCGGCARCLHAQRYERERDEPIPITGRCHCGHWGSYREDRQCYECYECYRTYDAQGRRREKPIDPDLPVPTEMDQVRRG